MIDYIVSGWTRRQYAIILIKTDNLNGFCLPPSRNTNSIFSQLDTSENYVMANIQIV